MHGVDCVIALLHVCQLNESIKEILFIFNAHSNRKRVMEMQSIMNNQSWGAFQTRSVVHNCKSINTWSLGSHWPYWFQRQLGQWFHRRSVSWDSRPLAAPLASIRLRPHRLVLSSWSQGWRSLSWNIHPSVRQSVFGQDKMRKTISIIGEW